jgi:DMSO/TMAO reductase YedYZ heme-binding membrane subunit
MPLILAAAHGPSPLWYASRGAGAVTLVLLSASLVLGIGEFRGWRPAGATRFAVAATHRTLSLLALSLLAVHVATVLLDPFPRIGLAAAFVPFASPYRPLWLGLGTLALDLLVALVVTSLVRRRLGYRAWRGVHWLAYACWPVAILHGLGTGSDARATWMLVLTAGCVAAVLAALAGRLTGDDVSAPARTVVAGGSILAVTALVLWLAQGPLRPGWARRAGTPAAVLSAFSPPPAHARAARPAPKAPDEPLLRPFSASVGGEVSTGTSEAGMAVVDLRMKLDGGPDAALRVRIGGEPLPDGGVRMERSAVTFGPPSRPGEFRGRIQYLQDGTLKSLVGSRDGRALRLEVSLTLGADSVTGTASGTPVGGTP